MNWYGLTPDVPHPLWFPVWLRTKTAPRRPQVKSSILWLKPVWSSGSHPHRFKDKIWCGANARHKGCISLCTQRMKQLQAPSCSHLQCLTVCMFPGMDTPLLAASAPFQLVLWYSSGTSTYQTNPTTTVCRGGGEKTVAIWAPAMLSQAHRRTEGEWTC